LDLISNVAPATAETPTDEPTMMELGGYRGMPTISEPIPPPKKVARVRMEPSSSSNALPKTKRRNMLSPRWMMLTWTKRER
jgi:hypothetical protein